MHRKYNRGTFRNIAYIHITAPILSLIKRRPSVLLRRYTYGSHKGTYRKFQIFIAFMKFKMNTILFNRANLGARF